MDGIYLKLVPLELRNAFARLEFDEETGEVLNPQILAEAQQSAEQTIAGVAMLVKDLETEADAIKSAEGEFRGRRARIERRCERLKALMLPAIEAYGGPVKTPFVTVSKRRVESVLVTDEKALPEEMISVKVERSPNKDAIKKFIKAGGELQGAEIVVSNALIISKPKKKE